MSLSVDFQHAWEASTLLHAWITRDTRDLTPIVKGELIFLEEAFNSFFIRNEFQCCFNKCMYIKGVGISQQVSSSSITNPNSFKTKIFHIKMIKTQYSTFLIVSNYWNEPMKRIDICWYKQLVLTCSESIIDNMTISCQQAEFRFGSFNVA